MEHLSWILRIMFEYWWSIDASFFNAMLENSQASCESSLEVSWVAKIQFDK